jgi:hypothetical protein
MLLDNPPARVTQMGEKAPLVRSVCVACWSPGMAQGDCHASAGPKIPWEGRSAPRRGERRPRGCQTQGMQTTVRVRGVGSPTWALAPCLSRPWGRRPRPLFQTRLYLLHPWSRRRDGASSSGVAGAARRRGMLANRRSSSIVAPCIAARAPLPQAASRPAEAWPFPHPALSQRERENWRALPARLSR